MLTKLIDYATVIALLALTVDIFIQIIHIHKRKTSNDISIKGATIRVFAAAILLVKYVAITDLFLLTGQLIFLLVYIVYFAMLIFYKK